MSITPRHIHAPWIAAFALLLWFLNPAAAYGQEPEVRGQADTTLIRIGEQIQYTISVDADSTDLVIFPEGQTFAPLEMVESFKTDTTRKADRFLLQKRYALTQFDSGTYLLPRQFIDINGKGYLTDSLVVAVGDVAVDTTQQQLYDIKPFMEVEGGMGRFWRMLLTGLLVLAVAGGLLYYFFFRKRKLTQEEQEAQMPPYDRALLELKRLERSKYLIQQDYKSYYSDLTNILRAYLEEEAHLAALESTTNQLLERLELLKDAGELELDDQTLAQFRRVLQTADLVKFAKSRPAQSAAEEDRVIVEQIVHRTHEALPEPGEDELLEEEARLAAEAERQRRRKWRLAGFSTLALLLLAGALAFSYYGWSTVRDEVFGTPTKRLLEGDWVRSSYGFPPVILESPEVLLRQENGALPPEVATRQEFRYQHPDMPFQVGSVSLIVQREGEYDPTNAIDDVLGKWEKEGAKNLITKEEEFITPTGIKGIRVFGTGSFPDEDDREARTRYTLLIFGGANFEQRVYLTWPEGDAYAEEMAERILETIDVKPAV